MMKTLIFVILFACSVGAFASTSLRVAFGDKLPPWVLKETNKGIIYDILVECFKDEKIRIIPKYYPYSRRINAFQDESVDAVIDINPRVVKEHDLEGFSSDIAYAYINYAISLKDNGYEFKSINDLLNVSLLSWQGARVHLGGEYSRMASKHKHYSETADQAAQVKMLVSKRVSVVQMDLQIFKYFLMLNKKVHHLDIENDISLHSLFGESPNSIHFRSRKVRDIFNRNLKKIKASGKYQSLIDRYSNVRQ